MNFSVSIIRKLLINKAIPCFQIVAKLNFNKDLINEWVKKQEAVNNFSIKNDQEVRSIKEFNKINI